MGGDEDRNGTGEKKARSAAGGDRHVPPDVPEPDVVEDPEWQDDRDKKPSKVPIDAPESDVLEDWDGEAGDRPSRVPIDAPEADVLDQARPADLDDEDREHG
jgi:hypothetical protein